MHLAALTDVDECERNPDAAYLSNAIGTRNVAVLALEGFAPRLRHPIWYALEQLAAQGVARSRPYVHVHRSYDRVLSPLEVLPAPAQLARAIRSGREELLPDLAPLVRLCARYDPPIE